MKVNKNKNDTGLYSIACLFILFITLATYQQVLKNDFIVYDDVKYITENPKVITGITVKNVLWAFTSTYAANWHPVTWLSHMIDARIYGLKPYGHHLSSVIIHAFSSIILFLFFARVSHSFWKSLFVSLLFALHPLHVQSVAWAAERKDVLSALFGFLTLFMYSKYVCNRNILFYLCSLFIFLLGLMSKPMIVTLPILMLLIDYWPLGRYELDELKLPDSANITRVIALIREKVPFFIFSILSGIITLYAQNKGGAIQRINNLSFVQRVQNAIDSYLKYIFKTLYPNDLAIFYQLPSSIPQWRTIIYLATIILVSIVTIKKRHRYPYLVVGWLWFIISLLPVIGIIQIGEQSMADRYTYIPTIGLFIMVSWGLPDLLRGFQQKRLILCLLSSVIILSMATMTWIQLKYWRNSITLFQHSQQVAGDNYIVHDSLGSAYYNQHNYDMAILEYKNVLRLNPYYAGGHHKLGMAFAMKNTNEEAIKELKIAVQFTPDNPVYHNDLGYALAYKGDIAGAINEFQEAIRLDQDYFDAHRNIGFAFYNTGRYNEAIHEFQQALDIYPANEEIVNILKVLSANNGASKNFIK